MRRTCGEIVFGMLLALAGGAALAEPVTAAASDNVRLLQALPGGKVALGLFTTEGATPTFLNVRGAPFRPPGGGEFGDYLKMELQTELTSAGRLDAQAGIVIGAALLQHEIDADASCASTSIRARFTVARGGRKVFDKILLADAQWDAGWMTSDAGAAPKTRQNYEATLRRLLARLFADPDFQDALI